MHDAASRKVPEAELPEPAALCPAPVHRYRVEEARHDGAEDDVAVEVAPLRDGAGDDRGASGSEGALKKYIIGDVYLTVRILGGGLKSLIFTRAYT